MRDAPQSRRRTWLSSDGAGARATVRPDTEEPSPPTLAIPYEFTMDSYFTSDYSVGCGLTRSRRVTMSWLRKSADVGNADGCLDLAIGSTWTVTTPG